MLLAAAFAACHAAAAAAAQRALQPIAALPESICQLANTMNRTSRLRLMETLPSMMTL